MRVYGTVDVLKFDPAAYTQAMKNALLVHFRQAARAFVRAAVPRIPVQTGMARGSFLNIGRFLRVSVPISPTKFGKKYYGPGSKSPISKTPESGAALTTPPENMIKFNTTNNRVTFEINTKVFHYTLEDILGVRSGPWGSFEAGRAAFIATIRTLRSRLPKIKSFVTKTTITFGRGSGITKAPPIRLRRQEKVGD